MGRRRHRSDRHGERAGADAVTVTATGRALKLLDVRVLRQATVLAYNHVLLLVAVLFLVSLPLALLIRGGRGDAHAHVAAE